MIDCQKDIRINPMTSLRHEYASISPGNVANERDAKPRPRSAVPPALRLRPMVTTTFVMESARKRSSALENHLNRLRSVANPERDLAVEVILPVVDHGPRPVGVVVVLTRAKSSADFG